MRDKHIKARFADLEADLGRIRDTLKTHARQDAVDAAHAVATSADDKAAELRAELAKVQAELRDTKDEFAGLRESVKQAAAKAAEPVTGTQGDGEPVTPITKAPRARRASSS